MSESKGRMANDLDLFPQLIKESIYVEIIIKNGRKPQKKIAKQKEQDGSKN